MSYSRNAHNEAVIRALRLRDRGRDACAHPRCRQAPACTWLGLRLCDEHAKVADDMTPENAPVPVDSRPCRDPSDGTLSQLAFSFGVGGAA